MEYRILNDESRLQIAAKQRLDFEVQHANVTLSIEVLEAQLVADPTVAGEQYDNQLLSLRKQLNQADIAVAVLDKQLPAGELRPLSGATEEENDSDNSE